MDQPAGDLSTTFEPAPCVVCNYGVKGITSALCASSGPLHWKVLGPGERWDCSPGRGFYTLCARDARLAENLPTVAGAVLKPLAVAVGVAGAAGLMAIPFLGR